MKILFSLSFAITCLISVASNTFPQEPEQPQESTAEEKLPLEAKSPPPELAMLTTIDENSQGIYTVVYWEAQLKDGSVSWVSKSVEKVSNLEFVTFDVIGGKKGVKGAGAIESLRKRLPIPILLVKNGKPLDPHYERFYRPGVVVIRH